MKKVFYKIRNSNAIFEEKIIGHKVIKFLYNNIFAYPLLFLTTRNPLISYLYGKAMNTKYSKSLIYKFVKKNNIDINESKKSISEFNHFNDFFYRELKPFSRTVNTSENTIVSAADGKILVFNNFSKAIIKYIEFDIYNLLKNDMLARKYNNCSVAIIRLIPTDYHRFHFPLDGYATKTKNIKGHYYSVSPIAFSLKPQILFENKRTYCEVINTHVDNYLFLEIGATMVGSIKQTYKENTMVYKGQEKGYFEFGGSTVILVFKNNKIEFDKDLLDNTSDHYETKISMGERIGRII